MTKRADRFPGARLASSARFSLIQWLGCLLAATLLVAPALAQEPEDIYLDIHGIIEQADLMAANGQSESAKAKYEKALTDLLDFKRTYPAWNVKVVAYRLNYLTEKIHSLSPTNAEPGEPAATTSAAAKAQPRKTAPATGSGMQIRLLTAGAEPRKLLRLHAPAGDKQTMTMTINMMMNMQAGGVPAQEMKLPPMQMVMDVTVKDVSADGQMDYESVVTDATVMDEPGAMPPVVEAMKTSLASLKGMTGAGTISDRGFSKPADIKLPAGADPEVRQSMEQMKEALSSISAPLPDEAVGAGARWEVKQPIKSQGMTINQTTTYQLVSVDDDRLTLKAALTQTAANQKVRNPAMPGLNVDLTKMTGTGTGESTLDLAHILPVLATVTSHSEILMGMNVGGQKQAMTMKMDMKLHIESK